jgi:hypothetical protein
VLGPRMVRRIGSNRERRFVVTIGGDTTNARGGVIQVKQDLAEPNSFFGDQRESNVLSLSGGG